MPQAFTIVGIGEALFDVFPEGARLGGAPLNVAVHAHALAQPHGGRGVIVSRIGQDPLGEDALAALRERGVTTDYIQTDPDRPTGQVFVDVGFDGQPTYEIARDAAWDVLQFDFDLEDLAQTTSAVCFGTLAQRDAQSRNTIYRFLDACRRAFRLFDVNLRGPDSAPFYDARVLRRSCESANAIKLNGDELPIVARLLGLSSPGAAAYAQAEAILKAFELDALVLTRGAEGTSLLTAGGWTEGEPVSYPRAEGADSVGAGDACSAAVLVGRCLRLPPAKIVHLANHVGAYVASQPGATPPLPESILAMARR